MVRMLRRKFFVLEDCPLFSNVVPQLTKSENCVFFYLLDVIIVVIWTGRQKDLYGIEMLTFPNLSWNLSNSLKSRLERKGHASLNQNLAKGGWVSMSVLIKRTLNGVAFWCRLCIKILLNIGDPAQNRLVLGCVILSFF